MTRKILLTAMVVLLSGGLLGSYFYFAGRLDAKGRSLSRCERISVLLDDQAGASIVDPEEIEREVSPMAIGMVADSIDLDAIERALNARGEIVSAQVYLAAPAHLAIEIMQRRPVVRFETPGAHFYCDDKGFIFPVRNASDVPVVTGKIPLTLEASYKGPAPENDMEWVMGMVNLAMHIDQDAFLRGEIAQIDVARSDELMLYTNSEGPCFIFGGSGSYREKFRKMYIYWRNISPAAASAGKTYRTINLKYNNQIICK